MMAYSTIILFKQGRAISADESLFPKKIVTKKASSRTIYIKSCLCRRKKGIFIYIYIYEIFWKYATPTLLLSCGNGVLTERVNQGDFSFYFLTFLYCFNVFAMSKHTLFIEKNGFKGDEKVMLWFSR